MLDLITKSTVHLYIDFTSGILKQIWLFPYPYGFCYPGTDPRNENEYDMIWYDIWYDKQQ